jgi:WD40 repeat protein
MVRRVTFAALLAVLGVVAPAAAEIRVLNASGGLVGTPVPDDRTNLWRWTDDGTGLLVARRGQGLRVSVADGTTSRVIALDHATSVGPGGRSAVVRDNPAQVTLRAADGAVVAAAALTNPDSAVSQVVWSPDGQRAAFVVEGNVIVVDADTGAVIARAEVPGASVYSLSEQAFSSDGTALVIKANDQVMRFDVASGALTTLAALPRGSWDPPAWSSSGPIATSADRVLLFGAPLAEINSAHPDLPVLWTPDGTQLTYMQWQYPGQCADPRASLRTVPPGSATQTLFTTSARIKAWAWSSDGQHVAVALARDPNKRGKRRPWPRHISRRFEMLTRAGDAAIRRVIMRAANGLRHGAGRAKTMQRVRLGLDPIDRRYDEAQDTAVQEAIVVEIDRWLHAAGFAGLGAADELDC